MGLSMQQASGLLLRRKYFAFMPCIYHPLSSVLDTLPTGQKVSIVGTGYEATTYQGIPCIKFTRNDSSESNVSFDFAYSGRRQSKAWSGTVSVWLAREGIQYTTYSDVVSIGTKFNTAAASSRFFIGGPTTYNYKKIIAGFRQQSSRIGVDIIEQNDADFHHVCMLMRILSDGGNPQATADVYVDGQYVGTASGRLSLTKWYACSVGISNKIGSIYISALRVWNRILDSSEIAELAQEFTPVAT